MRIIAVSTLKEFWEKHPTAEMPLRAWVDEVQKATWATTQDIKFRYASASFVGDRRVIFNIKGNDFRLIVAIAFRYQAVYIKFIGTHAQYDAVNAATVEQ